MDQKVLIGVPTGEFARRADFYDYINQIDKPIGTMYGASHGQSPAANRNVIIDQALKMGATHILFIDDDVLVPSDVIRRLLVHDVDIVSGLYLMRNFPHKPIAFDEVHNDGKCAHLELTPGRTGLVKVNGIGLGCCLIKSSVFNRLERPYIRLGELHKEHWDDDISFFNRCREANIGLYLDLDVKCGHIASVVLWPNQMNGKWATGYDTNGTHQATVPQLYEGM